MKKRTYTTGKELTDKQWTKFEPLIPEPIQSRKGGDVERQIVRVWRESSGFSEQGRAGVICPNTSLREVRVGDVLLNGKCKAYGLKFGKPS